MLIERTEHPDWLSNAYLVADRPGGHGVLVDSNGIVQPLHDAVARHGITITHVLVTHQHQDHVVTSRADADRYGVPLLAHPLTARAVEGVDETFADGDVIRSGDLDLAILHTPGHCPDHCSILAGGTDCLTADVLFRGTVGGTMNGGPTGYEDIRRSIMDRLMALPPATRIHPGHCAPSTIGEEWESNPFVRLWRGLDAPGDEPCDVMGEPATLLLWAPDYDGGNKALVRFGDGRESIVGGSRVRLGFDRT